MNCRFNRARSTGTTPMLSTAISASKPSAISESCHE